MEGPYMREVWPEKSSHIAISYGTKSFVVHALIAATTVHFL